MRTLGLHGRKAVRTVLTHTCHDNAQRMGPTHFGDRTKQAVDRRSIMLLRWIQRRLDHDALCALPDAHVPSARGNIGRVLFHPKAITGLGDAQSAAPVEHRSEQRRKRRGHMSNDGHGHAQVTGQARHQLV